MKFLRDLIPIILIVSIIMIFSIIPYFSEQTRLHELRQDTIYQCKLNEIFIKFASTAERARTKTALVLQGRLGTKITEVNREAANSYHQIILKLKDLPPSDCNTVLRNNKLNHN